MSDEMSATLLDNWTSLNNGVGDLSEDQLRNLINYEAATKKRKVFLERMHQRFCILRGKRERTELLEGGLL